MTIKADGGNVGIGTTSPNAKLNIRGTDGSGSVTPQEDVLHVGGNELGGVGGYAGIRIGGAGNTSYGAYIRGVKTTAYGNYWNTALTFSVTRTNTETTIDEVMRITSGANVLIGTTTDDGYKLRVNGTSYFDGLAHFGQTATSGSAFRWGSYGTAVSADTMLCMNQLWNGSGWTILNSGVGTTYLNLGGEVASPTIQFGTGPANTAATTKMIILNNGDVGIGTTSPGYKLDVSNAARVYGVRIGRDFSIANRATVRLDSNGDAPADILFGQTAAANQTDWTGVYWSISSRNSGAGAAEGNKFTIWRGGAHSAPNNSENQFVTITPDLNFGIGTTAPAYKLHVKSSGLNSIPFAVQRAANTNNIFYVYEDSSGNGNLTVENSGGNVGVFLNSSGNSYLNGGNVGIGTTAPVNKLQVTSASNDVEVLRVDNTAGNSGSVQGVTHLGLNFFGVGNNSGARITAYQNGTSGYAGGMYFSTRSVNSDSAPTEAMRITHDQLIGLGPVASFTTTHRVWIDKGSSTYAVYSQGSIQVNAGAIGVGVTPSATSGRIDAGNDIVAYSTSDQRLKENITPIANALDKVKALTGVEFDWKEETKEVHGYEGHDVGVIAQEVQAVLPEAVRTNDSGYLSVRYEKMIALLVEANKELASRVEELEKKLK
jgi:hypothetical protein